MTSSFVFATQEGIIPSSSTLTFQPTIPLLPLPRTTNIVENLEQQQGEEEGMKEQKKSRRTQYGGHMGEYITVTPGEGAENLKCFSCGDEALYHDSMAWWNEENDDLLCEKCFAPQLLVNMTGDSHRDTIGTTSINGYVYALTFH